jgi:hypothetical protein
MKRAILFVAFAALCGAQTTVNGGRDYKGTLKASGSVSVVDFTGSGSTAPAKAGTSASRPTACTQGQIYFATDVAAGQNLYFCTVTGVPGAWTQMSGNAAGTMTAGTGAPAGNCAPPMLYIDTTNQDLWYCGATNTWKKPTADTSGFVTAAGTNAWTGYNNFSSGQWRPPESTVANLPSASGNAGKVFMVTDAAAAGSCSSGGGSLRELCRTNGTSYECVGGCGSVGGGSGSGTTAYISSLITGPDLTRTITGGTHGFATAALLVGVYDNASPRNAISAGWTVHPTTYDVAITFASPQSNYYVVINGGIGPAGPTGPAGPSAAGGAGAVQTSNGSGGLADGGCTMVSGVINCVPAGGAAGSRAFPQGTTNTPPVNSVMFQAPTSVPSAYGITLPGAPAAGYVKRTNTNPSVESVSAIAIEDLPSGVGGSVFTRSTALAPSFSATPTFDLADVSVKSPLVISPTVMTASVTAVTFLNATAGARFGIVWHQAATGGPYTVTYGASISSTATPCTISGVAGTWTEHFFRVEADGSTVTVDGCTSSDPTVALSTPLPISSGGTGLASLPGSSGQFLYNTSGAVGGKAIATSDIPTAHVTRTLAITNIAPVAGDSGMLLLINPPTAIHLTRVFCTLQGATNVVLNLDKRTEAAIATPVASLLAADLIAVSGGATTSTFSNTRCNGTTSCAIAAHAPVVMTFTSVSGTPTALNCSVDYTVD